NKITEDAIRKMVDNLDPHSAYLTKEEVKALNEPLQGNFEGIGIQFNVLNDTIFVINPISGGPSEKVGIKAGDKIVKIEDEIVAGTGITNQGVRNRLLGEKGTKVNVSIKRRGVNELLEFTITRDKIPIFSLDAAYLVNDSIAYIKLNQFSLTTIDEFHESFESLNPEKIAGLILDLRNNGGGYLKVAFELADQFLDDGKLIVYTHGLNSLRRDYISTSEGIFEKGKLVILIDEGSASASEIVSGAVQDWDRGLILGRRSFGKGLVQRPFNLPDGSMLKLTVAKYYTPTGRLIQKPYDMDKKDYDKDLSNRYNNGELVSEDSILFPDSLKYLTLSKKRVVFGGGGIMPDYFIPLDTSTSTDYFSKLIRRGVLSRFVLNYIDVNRKKILKKHETFEEFKEKFTVSQSLLKELTDFAEQEDLELNEEEFEQSKNDISLLLKAYIARDLWNNSAFYEIYNETNEGYLQAVEIITDYKKYIQQLNSRE
ncbi:S41 family peptidase, partial [Bacteroidota bacterium]